ncbi:MAG: hypothetical protein FK734_18700 [Asgard group archaeon]|nr:hypothetical protein [Asgard group archaeon]
MSEEEQLEKGEWDIILGELDEIVHEINRFSAMIKGDASELEGDYPALIHYVKDIKTENKGESWKKIEQFSTNALETMKLLEETLKIKQQNKMIDRTILGKLPKNTNQIGSQIVETLNEVPDLIRIINENITSLLIDVKLKLGFPTVKVEKDVVEIKHQIDLLEENIKSHSKTKKVILGKSEQLVYEEAYRETYLQVLEQAQDFVQRCLKTHSKTFEFVYEKFYNRLNDYRNNPAYDVVIKDNCGEIENILQKWPTEGFNAFLKAQKVVRKIEDRLSDRRQSFIQQINADLRLKTEEYIAKINEVAKLELVINNTIFKEVEQSKTRLIGAINSANKDIDVVKKDPIDNLNNDKQVVKEGTNLTTIIYNATIGEVLDELTAITDQVDASKSTKEVLDKINSAQENSLNPETLAEIINTLPILLDFGATKELLLKELAVDLTEAQEKFVKKMKNINDYFGKSTNLYIPEKSEIVKLEIVDLNDLAPIEKIEAILKKSLLSVTKTLSLFEEQLADGLGFHVNPKLEARLSRYRRPSYKPTIKQAIKAINELERFTKDLAKETGKAITKYVKDLKKFMITSKALTNFEMTLTNIAKDSSKGSMNLSQITSDLEVAVEKYAKEISEILSTHKETIATILNDKAKLDFAKGMTLSNFADKHEGFISAIDLETAFAQQEEEKEPLLCKKCGAEIVWQQAEYNDMLGFNVLKVRCKNGHEDNLIGFAEETTEEEPQEFKCSSCDLKPTILESLDLFSDGSLKIVTQCTKKHKTEFVVKN